MSVSTSNINATFQRIELDAYIDGSRNSRVTGVEVSMGLSQVNATATISGIDWEDAEEGQRCEIWAGYNGQTDVIFKGEIGGRQGRYFPIEQPVTARDKFARLRLPWGGDDREYTNTTDDALIRNLLEAMGIPSYEANIEASDLPTLGTVLPIILKQGQPFFPMIERLDTLAGYRTFTDRAGNILRRRIAGNIGTGTIWTFTEGVNIISITTDRTVEGIINQCTVTGVEYEGLIVGGPGVAEASMGNPFVPSPPDFISETINDQLIEDDDTALTVARRVVADKNRRPEKITVESVFNPRLVPACVVAIEADSLELDGRYLIDTVRHSIQGNSARTTITTLGGALVNAETNLAPVASFVVQLVQESKDTAGVITSQVIVYADGSASYDPDGDTPTYLWAFSVDVGTVTPVAPTTAVAVVVIAGAATTLSVTLTVTDSAGATGTIGPQAYPLTAGTLQVQPLYLAWDDGMISASIDGQKTWNDYATGAAATCLAVFAATNLELWGADNGHIYVSNDNLKTAPVDTGAPAGGSVDVTALFLHELDTTRAWAGISTGAVYQGAVTQATPAVTWTLAGTIPASPIYSLRESIGALGSLRATAGTGYYGSEDGGATWTLLYTFTADNALDMVGGFDENLVSGHNVSSGAVVYAETGTTPTTPGGVDTMHLTFGWRTQALYGADDVDPANLYSTDSTLAALTDTTVNAPDAVNQMIRSGGVDGVIYLACDTGPAKWVVPAPTVAPWFLRQRAGKRCLQIGYGPIMLPAVNIDFVFITEHISGTWDGLHRYRFGVWSKITPPQAAWHWVQVVAHPYNKETWLILGFPDTDWNAHFGFFGNTLSGSVLTNTGAVSPLWLTRDGGATWTAVTLPESGGVSGTSAGVVAIGWQEQSGRWFAAGLIDGTTACWWTGSTATDGAGHMPTGADAYFNVQWLQSGMGGDMVASEADSPGGGTVGRLPYITNDGTLFNNVAWKTNAISGWSQPNGPFDVIRGQREFWQINTTTPGIAHWTDYRELDPTSDTGGAETRPNDVNGSYAYVAVGAEHVYFASNVASNIGFYRETHATALPSGAPDYPLTASDTTYLCATDRQSRRLFVGYVKIGSVYQWVVHDGSVWSAILMPDTSLSSGAGGIYSPGRGCPFAALGEVVIG